MPSQRFIGWVALLTPIWFLTVYVVMSGLRPEFSHFTKAVSELGSWDAPNHWVWNVLGYILPGLAVSLLGIGLLREFRPKARIATWALILSGLFMALSGVFPGDFENRQSLTMIMHLGGSLGSYVAFLVAAFGLVPTLRSSSPWRWAAWPSLALVLLSIVTGFWRSGAAPGLGQRLVFACFFLWVALMGGGLLRAWAARVRDKESISPPPLSGAG